MTPSPEQPLLDDLRAELGSLGAELREMASARWELARLEIESDLRSAKRLAVCGLVAIVMSLTALPLAAAGLAEALDGCAGVSRAGWLLVFAAGLLLLAALVGHLAWRRFRRNFIGLSETLEELREDVLWMREKGEGRG